MARAEESKAGNAKMYHTVPQRCPLKAPSMGSAVVPAECGKCQQSVASATVRLQMAPQTWAVLAALKLLQNQGFAKENLLQRWISQGSFAPHQTCFQKHTHILV